MARHLIVLFLLFLVGIVPANAQAVPAVLRIEESAWTNWLRTRLPIDIASTASGEPYRIVDLTYCRTIDDQHVELIAVAIPQGPTADKAPIPILQATDCSSPDLATKLFDRFPSIAEARVYAVAIFISPDDLSLTTQSYVEHVRSGPSSPANISPIALGRLPLRNIPFIVKSSAYLIGIDARFSGSAIVGQVLLGTIASLPWTVVSSDYLTRIPPAAAPRDLDIILPHHFLNYVISYIYSGKSLGVIDSTLPHVGTIDLRSLDFFKNPQGIDIVAHVGTEKLSSFEVTIHLVDQGETIVAGATVDASPLDCANPPKDIDPTQCGIINQRRPVLKQWAELYLSSYAEMEQLRYLLRPFSIKIPSADSSEMINFTLSINSIVLTSDGMLIFDAFSLFSRNPL